MSNKNKEPAKKPEKVRVAKKERSKLKGQTNWAFLVSEERKEGKQK